jgi:hypothetical protein
MVDKALFRTMSAEFLRMQGMKVLRGDSLQQLRTVLAWEGCQGNRNLPEIWAKSDAGLQRRNQAQSFNWNSL